MNACLKYADFSRSWVDSLQTKRFLIFAVVFYEVAVFACMRLQVSFTDLTFNSMIDHLLRGEFDVARTSSARKGSGAAAMCMPILASSVHS